MEPWSYVSFCVWIIFLIIVFLVFIYGVEGISSLFFLVVWIFPFMYPRIFIHSLVEGHFDCLQFGNKTVMSIHIRGLGVWFFFFFVDWVYDFLSRWQTLMGRIVESYD